MNLGKFDLLLRASSGEEYFVLEVCHERRKLALVKRGDWFQKKYQYKKSIVKTFDQIESELNAGTLIQNGCLSLPAMMLKPDKWLEYGGFHKWLDIRDKNYRIIKPIVENKKLWLKYIFGESISKKILKISKKKSVNAGQMRRLLNRFLTFGGATNALLPISYKKCGNRTVYDKPEEGQSKRGRKTRVNRHGQKVPVRSKARPMTAQDKLNILDLLKKLQISNREQFRKFSYKRLFEEYQLRYECHVIIRTTPNGEDFYNWLHDEEDRISFGMFREHLNYLLKDEDKLKLQVGELNFKKDKAVKTGLARDGIIGPGYCYAIDATILDLYVRYPYNPKIKTCGRPVLYLVVDVWSTCIVGYYLGFHGPDWVGASEALYHACINKSEWAKSIGWTLAEDKWPCHHTPRKVFGDNGSEVISEFNIKSMLLDELGIDMIDYAPIFRGDAKSVVERGFGFLNEDFTHFQPGYVHKQQLRDLPHPANDAVWDYRSLVIALGKRIIKHNNHANRLKRLNFTMAKNCSGITPQAIFNMGMEREMGGGRIIKDKAKLRFAFMREEEATVTGDCVKHAGLEYDYPEGYEKGVYGKAKFDESYKIPVRITNATTSYIWHRDDDGNIVELKLKDADHWAQNQLREAVMDKMEEFADELYELEQAAMREDAQLRFEEAQARRINSAQILDHPYRKGIPSDVKESKEVMAAFNHSKIVQLIREDYGTNKSPSPEPTSFSDIDEELAANY
ncbi:hypothetical protein [uncultured Neptuniibacter sp.]|uniref:hypothetical protein n=1 Tax=uncultured Neptuniibacter sp. TaxID=502143 RepID=UPI00263881DD|nr:hypothetical protein [uncultured Neptuniibacter sp.]